MCITLLRVILPEDRTVIGGFEIPLLLVVMALAVIVSLVITRYLSKIRWIYVPPAALGGPGAKKRKPVPVPARGAGIVSDPAAVPADEPGTSPSYEQKSASHEQKAQSHE